jgi:hypothetical protein
MRLWISDRPHARGLDAHGHHLALAAAATLLMLAVCGVAVAAHPAAGSKYSGYTSAAKVNGFRAPVSFTVSGTGSKLLTFQYGNVGCLAYPITGNPFGTASGFVEVGSILVSGDGSFSVSDAKHVNNSAGVKTVITSTVTGNFKTRKKATGKIAFVQKDTGPGGFNKRCGPIDLTFTATTK